MRPRNRLARLARALSGETQKDFAEKTGVHSTLLAQYELDQVEPGLENLERLARGAGLTVGEGEEILRLADTLRRSRERAGQGEAELFQELLAAQVSSIHQRLLRLPLPGGRPETEDPLTTDELWSRLRDLAESQALAVVRMARELQSRALAERLREESEKEASRDPGRAAFLARLAREVWVRAESAQGAAG
jgi:transcriptional regulator with XRE-family HTH domain